MDVYYDVNMWGKGRHKTKLTAVPVRKTVFWGKERQELFIPAVYTGKAGVVLDVCAKISTEAMAAFLKKWNKERRMSLKTPEQREQIDADNPGSRDFLIEMRLDGVPLVLRMSSSLRWYPKQIIGMENADSVEENEFQNDVYAEEWMHAYGCDRECCWHFSRLTYNWGEEKILSPRKIALSFRANMVSVVAGHFMTDLSCNEETVKAVHPVTGQEYTLTLHTCEQMRHSFAEIGKKGILYPEHCLILSYDVTPEIDRGLLDIRDCAQGDHPKKEDTVKEKGGETDGASAVFMAGKSAILERRAAVSSMHFEPVRQVQWRIVFEVKEREDLEVCFLTEG
ncbi:hypothetical protein C823_006714 [Eubacterium plexicaudatum ASF492]|uniref:Uncharacterized protein n=1 Tax=Eubacterium plexicaudatum ASF492 TaxID=1235802 RepID=N2A7I7_9FIRM|nr:hypothetical protein C823_006714 [Eubacterium plexicaudatum ASF492]